MSATGEGKKTLLEAVRSLKTLSVDSKSSQLDEQLDDLSKLVETGVPLNTILLGLKDIGIVVSKTLLQNHLKQNFPIAYKSNYTSKLKGGRKLGSQNSKPQDLSCQQPSNSKKKNTLPTKSKVNESPSSEAKGMVSDYLDQNK
jgi:hypothetical protein